MRTPVRESVDRFVSHAKYVEVDEDTAQELAEQLAREEIELPEWRQPTFPDEEAVGVRDVVDFFFVGNTINFAFRDFETGRKYTAEYDGNVYRGAFGMWAALKQAYENGRSILDGEYLADLTMNEARNIFEPAGDTEMPLLPQRVQLLNEAGYYLDQQYDGRYTGLVEEAADNLYTDNDDGLVDHLLTLGKAFEDSTPLSNGSDVERVRFDKRAQLAVAMAWGRFRYNDVISIDAPSQFTVFADYNLPNILRSHGILNYEQDLAQRIDRGETLAANSREEAEVRACAVYAADAIQTWLNVERAGETIYAPHLDAKLFGLRDNVETQPHRCKTTAY
jgi:hypothetical protein